jgi:Holliday junction resolvasome RuvABC DNA-binding subunit
MMHMQAAQAAAAQQLAQQLAQQMAQAQVPGNHQNVAAAGHANPPAPLVEALRAMGFSQEEAVHALRATNNDIHAAVNLLTT